MSCVKCASAVDATCKYCPQCGQIVSICNSKETYLGYMNASKHLCDDKKRPLNQFKSYSVKDGFSALAKTEVLFEVENYAVINLRSLPSINYSSTTFDVKGGSVKPGQYTLSTDKSCLVNIANPKQSWIALAGSSVEIITEERAKEKLKSAAYGAVGALATLGIGLVVGLLHASKKFYLVELISEDGNSIVLECRPNSYQELLLAIKNIKLSKSQQDLSLNTINSVSSEIFYNKNAFGRKYWFERINFDTRTKEHLKNGLIATSVVFLIFLLLAIIELFF